MSDSKSLCEKMLIAFENASVIYYNDFGEENFIRPSNEEMIAILKVIADEIVPEEYEPPCGDNEPWPMAYQHMQDAMWEQRQIIRQRLLAEIEQAQTHNN